MKVMPHSLLTKKIKLLTPFNLLKFLCVTILKYEI